MAWKRIKFYSVHDLAGYNNLEKALLLINDFSEQNTYTINDIIEFYQIKLYFDHKIPIATWTLMISKDTKQ